MSRFSHQHPDDPEGAMEAMIDRADHARKEARENPPASDLRVALAGMLAMIDARPDIGMMLGFQEWAAIQAARNALAKTDQPMGGCPMGGDF